MTRGVSDVAVSEWSVPLPNGITEKKGPSMTVMPSGLKSTFGRTRATSQSSYFSSIWSNPKVRNTSLVDA